MLSIVTFKWTQEGYRTKFTAEHVNRLYEMVKRNTTVEFQFFCVTDDGKGIVPEVTIVPLWENPVPEYGNYKRPNCFYRLKMFSPEMRQIFGDRFVWLDLDCLIVGNIDHILKTRDDFKIWYTDGERSKCNGSLVAHKIGTRTDLWEKFDPEAVDKRDAYRQLGFIGSDQAWIAQNLTGLEPLFGQKDGVYSYRCHLEGGKPLPADACVVFFHGDDKPDDLWGVPWIRRTMEAAAEPELADIKPRSSNRVVGRDKLRIVTWLWKPLPGQRKRFNSEAVNVLLSMLDRNYKRPYELVCVTDSPVGIDGAVRIVPMWPDLCKLRHPIESNTDSPVCYRRLKMFSPEMADILAPRFVSMDLDVVVTGEITTLFDRPEEFVAWWPGHTWAPYSGSLILMTAGARRQVWEQFDPARTPAAARDAGLIGTDQAAIAHILGGKEAVLTDQDGVYSFRKLGSLEERRSGRRQREMQYPERNETRRGLRIDRHFRAEARRVERHSLPQNCKLVFFPGPLKPWDQAVWGNYAFVRKDYK